MLDKHNSWLSTFEAELKKAMLKKIMEHCILHDLSSVKYLKNVYGTKDIGICIPHSSNIEIQT